MEKWKATGKHVKINRILDILTVLIVITFIASVFIGWANAPSIIPTHYGINGQADAYGSKNTIFIFLPIVLILYIGLAILSKYPQIYNYAVEINPRNKERQYSMATTFIKVLNIEVIITFFYIQMKQLVSMNNNSQNLSIAFLPISMIILFGSIGFYIYKSVKYK